VPLGAPQTGSPNIGGSIVTAGGLVFIGATNDAKFRAFDSANGRELWQADLPSSAFATPMTYQLKGKQYVVVAAGGGNDYSEGVSDALVAYRLP
jgi:quinoprotein glucose dehydrogenase